MKKGFTLVELIISISLITIISLSSIMIFRNVKTSYADPYESLRKTIADATLIYLNTVDTELKEELDLNNEVFLNTNLLINEGLLQDKYYVENINKNVLITDIEVRVFKDKEGFVNYNIDI